MSVPEQGDYFIDDAQCDRSVFNGEFSCCRRTGGHRKGTSIPCDRDRIAAVLEPFYAARVAELHKEGKPHLARLWTYLGSAARTSAGSFSKFRRAMSMRSSESPLAGGDE